MQFLALRKTHTKQHGFTLLEVIIAMAIMSFISIFTAQAIKRASQAKIKIQGDIERVSMVRDALRVIEKDINNAFNYKDINIELWNETGKAREKKAQENAGKKNEKNGDDNGDSDDTPATAPTQASEPFVPIEEKIVTHFVGESEEIHFTTLNNIRVVQDDPVSDQAEVGYFTKSCRGRIDKSKSSNCLWRRISPYLDDEVQKGGTETVLLEDVTAFSLRYMGPGREEEWVSQWRSTEGGDAITIGQFPYAVEVTLEMEEKLENKKTKPTRMTMVAAIRNPNNKKKQTNPEEGLEGTGSGQPSGSGSGSGSGTGGGSGN